MPMERVDRPGEAKSDWRKKRHSWHSVARLGQVWARVTPRHFAWQAFFFPSVAADFALRLGPNIGISE